MFETGIIIFIQTLMTPWKLEIRVFPSSNYLNTKIHSKDSEKITVAKNPPSIIMIINLLDFFSVRTIENDFS